MSTIEEQMAMKNVASFEEKQREKIEAQAKEAKRKADEAFLKDGKCWYNLFNGKEEDLANLKTYMGKWCMDRVCLGENVGLTKDFIAGVRMLLEMMESYPKEYAEIMTRNGGTK